DGLRAHDNGHDRALLDALHDRGVPATARRDAALVDPDRDRLCLELRLQGEGEGMVIGGVGDEDLAGAWARGSGPSIAPDLVDGNGPQREGKERSYARTER